MGDGFREIDLTDPEQGAIRLLVALPDAKSRWGPLAPLQGTVWARHIQLISGEAFSHALHGWATPLMREIGIPPLVRADRIPFEEGRCSLYDNCIGASPQCRPGRKVPACYEAPEPIASRVVLAWRAGRYVVVLRDDGFVLV